MRQNQHRRLFALLAVVAACGAAAVFLITWSGGGDPSGAGRRGDEAEGADRGRSELAVLRATEPGKRVATEVERSAEEAPRPVEAAAPVEPGPITETRTFLSGAVRLVDAEGVIARHRDVRLFVRFALLGQRSGPVLSVESVGGQFDVTFVRRGEGPLALENGSRRMGDGPFEGQVEIFGAELAGAEVPLGLLRDAPGGALVPTGRVAFDLDSTDATVLVRAPRAVTLDVVEAKSGARVGPITVRAGSRRTSKGVLARGPTSPLELFLPSGHVGSLEVAVRGFADASLDVPEDRDRIVRVEMERWAALTVRVLVDEPEDGDEAARSVAIELRRVGEVGATRSHSRTEGGQGRWRDERIRPGAYIVSARQGGSRGFTAGLDASPVQADDGVVATRAIELSAGAHETVEVDLREAAGEVQSGIVLALRGDGREVLPASLEVSLESTRPARAARSVTVPLSPLPLSPLPLSPGATSTDVPVGDWPAGRYRAVVMGGRAVVDFEHLAAHTPTRVEVDLTRWVEWSVRLVRSDTGEPAPRRWLQVDLPDGAEPLFVQPDEDGVFRFWGPPRARSCWVAWQNGLNRLRCALPPHGPGVLEVVVPSRASAPGSGVMIDLIQGLPEEEPVEERGR